MIRLFGHYVSKRYLLLGGLELALFFISLLAGFEIGYPGDTLENGHPAAPVLWVAALYGIVMFSAMMAMGLYQRTQRASGEGAAGLILRLAISLILATMALSLVFYAFQPLFLGRKVVGSALIISFAGVLFLRALFYRVFGSDASKHRLLVLGTGRNAAAIHALEKSGARFTVVRFVGLGEEESCVPEELQASAEAEGTLLELAVALNVAEVVVAPDDRNHRLPVDVILDCKMNGFAVLDLLTFFEKETARINTDLIDPSWIFFCDGFFVGTFAEQWKRFLDVTLSLVLLVPGGLLMGLVGLASLLESRGRHAVLYHQVRIGRHGKPFRLYKVRSMRPDAEADGVARWAEPQDARITPLGRLIRKTRLDELPQLFNVLRGEMSLVGPRPERPEFVEILDAEIPYYRERHRVKPGITGWAQLLYEYGSSAEDAKSKLQYDLYYVKNASPFLDLVILLETVEVILLGKGAR
jgi:sugar transferase (PEP-CTERM system associated)